MEYTQKDKVYEDDPEIDVVYRLNEYADANIDYNSLFLDSIMRMFSRNGYLSGNQINTLIDHYNNLNKTMEDKNEN